MAFFRVGDAVGVKKSEWEWCYGIGLIIDRNPKYWFVQFPNGQLIALKSVQLTKVSAYDGKDPLPGWEVDQSAVRMSRQWDPTDQWV
tara:strand:+ start:596 stop:856 length:261 start_codon:yes stop_codon:yes gene_type:complete